MTVAGGDEKRNTYSSVAAATTSAIVTMPFLRNRVFKERGLRVGTRHPSSRRASRDYRSATLPLRHTRRSGVRMGRPGDRWRDRPQPRPARPWYAAACAQRRAGCGHWVKVSRYSERGKLVAEGGFE